jgi:2-oxoisovalerate dehydrogenase E1 component alpha subunit
VVVHNPEHLATGQSAPATRLSEIEAEQSLSDERLLAMYETMLLARALDERQWILNRQGRQAFVISCQGHEAAQVGSASALRPGLDIMAPYYRDLAAALVFGVTPRDVMLEALSRQSAPWTGGRQMPSHFGDPALKILSSSSVVATQISHATGAALASKIRGDGAVAIAYFGDGATSEGDFHEALNFAAIHRLPVIYFCEDNGLAISVPLAKQMPVVSVAERAAAYNMPGVVVDGGDLLAVYTATTEAVERALRGQGPTLIDAHVARLTPHSSDDDHSRYRSPDELAQLRQRDPLVRAQRLLREAGKLDEHSEQQMLERVRAQVEDALQFALAAPEPDPATATTHVFKE